MKKRMLVLLMCLALVFGNIAMAFADSDCDECNQAGDTNSGNAVEEADVNPLEETLRAKAEELRKLAEKNGVLEKYGPIAEDVETAIMLSFGDEEALKAEIKKIDDAIAEVKKLGTGETPKPEKTVKKLVIKSYKVTYNEGEEFDRSSVIAELHYNNNDVEALDVEKLDIRPGGKLKETDTSVVFYYDGKSVTKAISVKKKADKKPDKEVPSPGTNPNGIPNAGVPNEYDFIYSTEKVTVPAIYVEDITDAPISKPVKFEFYNTTTQRVEFVATAKNGVISNIELIKDHHYLVRVIDNDYEMIDNVYFHWSKALNKTVNDKDSGSEVKVLYLHKRDVPVADAEKKNRVHIMMQVKHCNVQTMELDENYDFGDAKVTFTSPDETITVPIVDGVVEADLVEDVNYMVTIGGKFQDFFLMYNNEGFVVRTFPIVVKDHSELGAPKLPYTHLTCGSMNELMVLDKDSYPLTDAKPFVSKSGNTTITGFNFLNGNYILHDRVNNEVKVKQLEGKDYDVIDIDAINLYRNEISKLAQGTFNITTKVQAGKNVKNVYYIDKDGSLKKLEFKQVGDTVSFVMNSLSLYDNVVEYGEKEQEPEANPEKPEENPAAHNENGSSNAGSEQRSDEPGYVVLEGNGAVWHPGSVNGLKFRFAYSKDDKSHGTYDKFVGIKVDGEEVAPEFYTTKRGSVIINLKSSYLKRLRPGKHTLTAKFSDGKESSAEFTVARARSSDIVRTGDSEGMVHYALAMVVAGAVLAGFVTCRKRIINL